jgi:putative methyltransferase (TIGR04325 family)
MHLRETIHELIPPLAAKAFKQLRSIGKTYKTFNEALLECSGSLGYEDPELVNMIVEETKEYLLSLNESHYVSADQTILHILLPFSLVTDKKKVNVLDIGGSCGMHYFPVKKIFGHGPELKWHVAETKSLSEAARIFENEELKFFDNIKDACRHLDNVDIIISSGAIQYCSNPRTVLEEMIDSNARFILLTRLSLTLADHDIISVQKSLLSQNSFEKLPSGYIDKIIKYPHTNLVEEDFKKIIGTKYDIRIKFEDNSGIQRINFHKSVGYGLLLERK